MSCVNVEDRITKDLGQTEEVIFTSIALKPELSAESIREDYSLKPEKMSEVLDSLFGKGLIEQVEDGSEPAVWRVTELGRLMLLKCVQVLRFDVMEAELREQPPGRVNELKEKKEFLEEAYKRAKVLGDE